MALGDALRQGLSIRSAISRARESVCGDPDTLVAAFRTLDGDAADRAMESALALRPFDRCVEDVLLQSLDEIAGQAGDASATWALAADWADGWLRRAQRLAPPPHRPLTILLGDAGGGEIDGDLLAQRALQLFCDRAGVRVVALPIRCVAGLASIGTTLARGRRRHRRQPALVRRTPSPGRVTVADAFGALPYALFRCDAVTADA